MARKTAWAQVFQDEGAVRSAACPVSKRRLSCELSCASTPLLQGLESLHDGFDLVRQQQKSDTPFGLL
jgi:hypothetical protein